MSQPVEIIKVTWLRGAYYVSKPNWDGGEVVALTDYAALQKSHHELKEALDGFRQYWIAREETSR